MSSGLDSLLPLNGVCVIPVGMRQDAIVFILLPLGLSLCLFSFFFCFLSGGSALHNGCHFLHWHMLKAVKKPLSYR